MIRLISPKVLALVAMLISTMSFSAPQYYPIQPSNNRTVFGTGLGLESGMLGIRFSHWLKEPNVIFNFAFGLEGFSPVFRFPLVNKGNYDFYLNVATMFTPGALGKISGDGGGLLFSKDTFLYGTGMGIQRWLRERTNYGFYFSAGITYWFQVTGDHEGGDIGISPEFQIGVVY